jgi:hypothetical protein
MYVEFHSSNLTFHVIDPGFLQRVKTALLGIFAMPASLSSEVKDRSLAIVQLPI